MEWTGAERRVADQFSVCVCVWLRPACGNCASVREASELIDTRDETRRRLDLFVCTAIGSARLTSACFVTGRRSPAPPLHSTRAPPSILSLERSYGTRAVGVLYIILISNLLLLLTFSPHFDRHSVWQLEFVSLYCTYICNLCTKTLIQHYAARAAVARRLPLRLRIETCTVHVQLRFSVAVRIRVRVI